MSGTATVRAVHLAAAREVLLVACGSELGWWYRTVPPRQWIDQAQRAMLDTEGA